jgi:hypothetical protein
MTGHEHTSAAVVAGKAMVNACNAAETNPWGWYRAVFSGWWCWILTAMEMCTACRVGYPGVLGVDLLLWLWHSSAAL